MKKLAIFGAFALAFVMSISACSTTEGAQEIPQCQKDGNKAAGCEVVIDYRGSDLHCVSWNGSHSETGLTCDFPRFYEENSIRTSP